jgi:hypothetical protein
MLPQEQLSTTLPRVELGQSIMKEEPIIVWSSVHPKSENNSYAC